MLLLRTERLPEGPDWLYEVKLDGYRALAVKSGGNVQLRSRNDNDFSMRYARLTKALDAMPDETVIDGEIVALDKDGKPSFNALQNYGSSSGPMLYYVFDVLILSGRDVMGETLDARRALLEKHVLAKLDEPIRYSPELQATLPDLIRSVKAQGLEGLVGKRRSSKYEPGLRSGAWQKMRTNQGQEFVIAGYTPSPKNFDALVIGYYEGGKLIVRGAHAQRVHSGVARRIVQEDQRAGNWRLPLRQSTGEEGRTMGRRTDGRQDGGMSVAEARTGRAVRVCGVDGRRSSSAFPFYCASR
jgi:ATP-dependent DNA ligase